MTTLESRLLQVVILAPIAAALGYWAWQCARVWVERRHRAERHELAPWRPLPIRGRR